MASPTPAAPRLPYRRWRNGLVTLGCFCRLRAPRLLHAVSCGGRLRVRLPAHRVLPGEHYQLTPVLQTRARCQRAGRVTGAAACETTGPALPVTWIFGSWWKDGQYTRTANMRHYELLPDGFYCTLLLPPAASPPTACSSHTCIHIPAYRTYRYLARDIAPIYSPHS